MSLSVCGGAPGRLLSNCGLLAACCGLLASSDVRRPGSGAALRIAKFPYASHEYVTAGHVRSALRRPAVAIFGRRLADQPGEPGRERTEARVADEHADLGDGQVRRAQQVLCSLDPATRQIPHRCLAV